MRAMSGLALVLWSSVAWAADVGEIVVLDDPTGVVHGGMMLQQSFCKETAKKFYQSHNDNYDGLITFTTKLLDDLQNVQQGTPVKSAASGIGTDGISTWNNPAAYGSAGKLAQCVFMGSVPKLPDSPDGPATVMFGLPLGISGVELVAHEYGHHWLLWVEYDKADGRGKRPLLRGDEDGPNGHYNHFANSHSVMYGSFVTDNGGGQFTLRGGPRKFSELDQYLMGLRSPAEVAPIFYVDDGADAGSPSVPIPNNGSSSTVTGARVDVSIDDVIRAMGPRVPSAASAQHCWRVAFVLVAEPGKTATAAQIEKVERYRARFVEWFNGVGTDGRGTMDTRLAAASGCLVPAQDGGVDGGPVDAGTVADAGPADAGGGEIDPDAGEPQAQPADPVDAGKYDPWADTGKLRPGCECNSGIGGAMGLGVMALLGLLRARRTRAPRA